MLAGTGARTPQGVSHGSTASQTWNLVCKSSMFGASPSLSPSPHTRKSMVAATIFNTQEENAVACFRGG